MVHAVINAPHSTKTMAMDLYGEELRTACVFFCAIQRRMEIGMATQRLSTVIRTHNNMLTGLNVAEAIGVVAQM